MKTALSAALLVSATSCLVVGCAADRATDTASGDAPGADTSALETRTDESIDPSFYFEVSQEVGSGDPTEPELDAPMFVEGHTWARGVDLNRFQKLTVDSPEVGGGTVTGRATCEYTDGSATHRVFGCGMVLVYAVPSPASCTYDAQCGLMSQGYYCGSPGYNGSLPHRPGSCFRREGPPSVGQWMGAYQRTKDTTTDPRGRQYYTMATLSRGVAQSPTNPGVWAAACGVVGPNEDPDACIRVTSPVHQTAAP